MTVLFVGGSNKINIRPTNIIISLEQIGLMAKDISIVVCGLNEGPEVAGKEWAVQNNKYLDEHLPHFEKYQGGVAWVVRNKVILAHADVMLMYWDGKSAGTRNLMNAGAKKGLTVYKIQVDGDKVSRPMLWDRVVPEEEWGWTSEW
jgi:hypothetical protein